MKQIRFLALLALATFSTHCVRVYLGDVNGGTAFITKPSPNPVQWSYINFIKSPTNNFSSYFENTYLEIPDQGPIAADGSIPSTSPYDFCYRACANPQALVDAGLAPAFALSVPLVVPAIIIVGSIATSCAERCNKACGFDQVGTAVINAFGGGNNLVKYFTNLLNGNSVTVAINKGITSDMLPKGKLTGSAGDNNLYTYSSYQDLAEDLFASYAKVIWLCFYKQNNLQYCANGSCPCIGNAHCSYVSWYTPN